MVLLAAIQGLIRLGWVTDGRFTILHSCGGDQEQEHTERGGSSSEREGARWTVVEQTVGELEGKKKQRNRVGGAAGV